MTTQETLKLSAWKKWTLYGRFPWKLLLHISLLACTTARLLAWNHSNDEYFRATTRAFSYFFFPDDYDFPASRVYNIYTYDVAKKAMGRVVQNYEKLDHVSVDVYEHYASGGPNKAEIEPVRLTLTRYANLTSSHPDPFNEKTYAANQLMRVETVHYNVTSHDLGPFDDKKLGMEKVDEAITGMIDARFHFRVKGFNIINDYRICLTWEVTVRFDFARRGMITLYLDTEASRRCDNAAWGEEMLYQWAWLDLLIFFFSVVYILLTVKKLRQQINLYLYLKRRALLRENTAVSDVIQRSMRWLGKSPVTWDQLKWSDRLKFFDLWFVLTVIACLFSGTTSMISIFDWDLSGGEAQRLFGSLGCSFLWINILRYMQYNRNYYMVILTMRRGGPRVLRFMVGVLPIMMGYAFFGMTYFGAASDRFETFGASMVTLFAVLNGDVIRETFLNLMPVFPVISQIYLYSFISLFIYVVLNVFIAIIEEAFFVSKSRGDGGTNADAGMGGHGHQDLMRMASDGEARDRHVHPNPHLNSSEDDPNYLGQPTRRTEYEGAVPQDIPVQKGLLTESLYAASKSWDRFDEFLHINNIDEVMEEVANTSFAMMQQRKQSVGELHEPLLQTEGGGKQ